MECLRNTILHTSSERQWNKFINHAWNLKCNIIPLHLLLRYTAYQNWNVYCQENTISHHLMATVISSVHRSMETGVWGNSCSATCSLQWYGWYCKLIVASMVYLIDGASTVYSFCELSCQTLDYTLDPLSSGPRSFGISVNHSRYKIHGFACTTEHVKWDMHSCYVAMYVSRNKAYATVHWR